MPIRNDNIFLTKKNTLRPKSVASLFKIKKSTVHNNSSSIDKQTELPRVNNMVIGEMARHRNQNRNRINLKNPILSKSMDNYAIMK